MIDDLVLGHRAGAVIRRDCDGQALHARVKILQAIAESAVGQAVNGDLDGAIAVHDGCRVQPHAGKDAAEGIDACTELVEGVRRKPAHADQSKVDQRLTDRHGAERERERAGAREEVLIHRLHVTFGFLLTALARLPIPLADSWNRQSS
jgi:hypothetical protein